MFHRKRRAKAGEDGAAEVAASVSTTLWPLLLEEKGPQRWAMARCCSVQDAFTGRWRRQGHTHTRARTHTPKARRADKTNDAANRCRSVLHGEQSRRRFLDQLDVTETSPLAADTSLVARCERGHDTHTPTHTHRRRCCCGRLDACTGRTEIRCVLHSEMRPTHYGQYLF